LLPVFFDVLLALSRTTPCTLPSRLFSLAIAGLQLQAAKKIFAPLK